MSFLLTLNASVRESRLVVDACCRLNWPIPVEVDEVFRGRRIRGLKVTPAGSYHSIYVDLETGDLVYDSDIGSYADAMVQSYNAALIYDEAMRHGYSVTETRQGDDILLTVVTP